MAKAENSNAKAKDKDAPSFEGPRHRPHWLAAFTCLVFGVLLWGRQQLGWRGHKAIRWTLAGFCLLMLAYFGSKLVREFILHI